MRFYSKPIATFAMLGLFGLVFAAQLLLAVRPNQGFLESHITTLITLGGLNRLFIEETGQYYRLLTAAFLHSGPMHLFLNAYAFYIAASFLESYIGRLYMLCIFMLGVLCSSLAAFYYNDIMITSVGASGGIMSLFGCLLVIARFLIPVGVLRSHVLTVCLQVAIVGLLPILNLFGFNIDYAGHWGGFAAGALTALIACFFPIRIERFWLVASALLITGGLFTYLLYGFWNIYSGYDMLKATFAA